LDQFKGATSLQSSFARFACAEGILAQSMAEGEEAAHRARFSSGRVYDGTGRERLQIQSFAIPISVRVVTLVWVDRPQHF
jgi:hypothetical protein